MKKFLFADSFSVRPLAVLAMLVAALLVGCFGMSKQVGKEQQQLEEKKQSLGANKAPTSVLPIDSMVKSIEFHGDDKTYRAAVVAFDTTHCHLFPDLNAETVFSKPEYKRLFGMSKDYGAAELYRFGTNDLHVKYWLTYKSVRFENVQLVAQFMNGCLVAARPVTYPVANDPSDAKITIDEARKLAMSLNYGERTKFQPAGVNFHWEVEGGVNSPRYPKGELMYVVDEDSKSHLVYHFLMDTYNGPWNVVIDAISGELMSKSYADSPCGGL